MDFKKFGFLLLITGLLIVGFSGFCVFQELPEVMSFAKFHGDRSEWAKQFGIQDHNTISKLAIAGRQIYDNYVKQRSEDRAKVAACFFKSSGSTLSDGSPIKCPMGGYSFVVTYFGAGLAFLGIFLVLSAKGPQNYVPQEKLPNGFHCPSSNKMGQMAG